jgi:uncharacterized protein (DUF1501 family)
MDWMPKLYAEIDAAVSAFYEWTRGNGLDRNVTLFTDSEFGRTLYANAKAGSEPGWGNHQFVIGGAVLGGEIYGQFPDMVSDPLTPDGAWIPTTTRGQYHATLASWIGLTPRELDALSASAGVPNLALLGFMAG